MTLNRTALTAALLTATALVSAPVHAQDAHRDNKQRESARTAQERAQQPQRSQQPQREQQPQRTQQPQRETQRAQQPERVQPLRDQAQPRYEPRRDDRNPRVENRGEVAGRAVPRTDSRVNPGVRSDRRYEGDRHDSGAVRSYGRDRGYAYSPRYAPRTYYRPYVFRPRISIGFGIFAGYPVPYSYSYGYPITVYGYRAPRVPVMVGPGSPLYGGVALEIAPYDADVFVDGNYAGKVEDFDGSTQPLTLAAGTHRIEVQAPGLVPLVFDVTIQPGQVIPYRGELQP